MLKNETEEIPAAPKAKHIVTLSSSEWGVARYGAVEFLRNNPFFRGVTGFLAVSTFIVVVLSFLRIPHLQLPNLLGVGIFICPTLFWLATVSGPSFTLEFPQQKAAQEKQIAEKKFEETHAPEDALTLDFARLNEYYLINQTQARSSFRWAIFSMFLGMSTIVAGIWFFYFRNPTEPDKFMASLSAAAGVVVDMISGLFLYLHARTQERSLVYFEQLARQKRMMMAIRMVAEYEDLSERATARAMVIKHLLSTDAPKNR